MTILQSIRALALIGLAACGSAKPFESAHFKPVAAKLGQPAGEVYVAEVPKGYQNIQQAQQGAERLRWDYWYADSALFYVANAPALDSAQAARQKMVAFQDGQAPGRLDRNAPGDSGVFYGQDRRGRYWMERQVASMRVGYKNIPHEQLYLFNYAIESFKRK